MADAVRVSGGCYLISASGKQLAVQVRGATDEERERILAELERDGMAVVPSTVSVVIVEERA